MLTTQLNTRVTEQTRKTLDQLQAETGKTIAELIRLAVEHYSQECARKLAELEAELNKY